MATTKQARITVGKGFVKQVQALIHHHNHNYSRVIATIQSEYWAIPAKGVVALVKGIATGNVESHWTNRSIIDNQGTIQFTVSYQR